MSARTVLATTTAGLMIAAGAGGYMLWNERSEQQELDEAARNAATSFASAWSDRTLDRANYVGTEPAAAAEDFRTTTAQLGNGNVRTSISGFERNGNRATAVVNVAWTVSGGRTFSWVNPIELEKSGDSWGVVANNRSLWHPKLQANDAFVVDLDSGLRGEIRGRDNAAIMTNQSVYDISLDPTKATLDSARRLENTTGVGGLRAKVTAAKASGSKSTIDVITYRKDDYEERSSGIRDLAGAIVRERKQPLAANRTFGQPLLGAVGPVTAEMLKKDPSTYRSGMFAGTSGLQRQYDGVLLPKAGLKISARSQPDAVLFGAGAQDGKNLGTTLDPKVQTAAEKALDSLPEGSMGAVVAIDVPTGGILAAANAPTYGLERAVTGRYSPGSTFKIVSAYELLKKGLNPDTKVACPQETKIDGRAFRNFEGETLGDPSFRDDFAHSCNTAFVNSTKPFGASDLQQAASLFGFGTDLSKSVGVNGAYSGSVPASAGPTDTAAMTIGQGRILASPMMIASVAASIARGSYVPPVLVTSPAQGGDRTPKPLDAGIVNSIRQMMRLTVTDGTATLVEGVPGGEVHAKTGTAEFFEGGKAGAHAWLAGWQGNVAFAVLVADVPAGKGGGTVAAPVARDFLSLLARS
ncbi:cell division protein FtsI/penicillin-binding protein 2 [Yimella lutea]|uniref:Cell division protein FtsI/penicillin-binding protein 2 n=1 Tax=Yimella lutea TaxID=587872 RepID=A0A542ED51_9MICO|nr:penicillin-binding transpeptidase domain-containing protein [Yimella lutea]TQJ13261.1 cell division protein FtsI/penicillin-binding protein 2 [Yimella lutea]